MLRRLAYQSGGGKHSTSEGLRNGILGLHLGAVRCCAPPPHPHHPSLSIWGRKGEREGWFFYFRFSQKQSLSCIFEYKEFIWEAVLGNTSPRKLGKGRQTMKGVLSNTHPQWAA